MECKGISYMSSIKPRLLTAVIGIPLVLILLILSESYPWIMFVSVSVLNVLMTLEILSARRLNNNFLIVLPKPTGKFCLIVS